MTPTKLHSFVHQRLAFISGDDTPTAFLGRCLELIDRRENDVRAFVALNREGALSSATASTARWAAGRPLSPIDGMPIGIKDVIETACMPTGQGSAQFAGVMTGRDAAAVLALREAGAIILGKTVTTEFAATFPGATRNPCDLGRTPGGSSSGSAAAVSAGMLPAALGTQVVGSIIRPSSYCGVYGFKPSFGALNRGGCNDQLSQSCLGVIGASIDDVRAVADAIVQRVGGDAGYPGLELSSTKGHHPQSLAVLELPGYLSADPAARMAFESLCERLRAAGLRLTDRSTDVGLEKLEQALASAFQETQNIVTWESNWPLREYSKSSTCQLSPHMLVRVEEGLKLTLSDYRAAILRRQALRELAEEILSPFDASISLATTGIAPMGILTTGNPAQNVAASYLAVPVVSLPLMQLDGLPLGLQVMGLSGADGQLLNIATNLSGLFKTNNFD